MDETEDRLRCALIAALFVRDYDAYAKVASYQGKMLSEAQYDAAMEEAIFVADEAMRVYRAQTREK